MFISELSVKNIKRITAVEVAPDSGEPVIITGNNGQGKSSVLDAILLALQNKGLEDPVRHGSSKGTIKLKLTDPTGAEHEYTVERAITAKTNSLRITTKDGEIKSPQAFLNSLLGNLAFDPLEFMRMKPKEQAAAIRALVGLDTSTLDAEYASTFAQRTEVNRALAEATAQLKAMSCPDVPEDTGEVEQSASEMLAELDKLKDIQKNAIDMARSATEANRDAHRLNTEVAEKRRELEALIKSAEQATKRSTELSAAAEQAKGMVDESAISELAQRISSVDQINAGIRAKRDARERALQAVDRYNAKDASVREIEKRAEALTAHLDNIQTKKLNLTREVKMPVEGMTFDDAGVFVGGIRLDQKSTAEQIHISTCVAMRGNPKLRLILIREGALLSREHLKAVVNAAKEADYQIFIEKFQEDPGDVGLHIEDGAVTHIDGHRVAGQDVAPEPDAPKKTPSDSLL